MPPLPAWVRDLPWQTIWVAVAAIGTTSAVIVALFLQWFLPWWNSPVLKISLYESNCAHLKNVRGTYLLPLQLTNTGYRTARNTLPTLTGASTRGKDGNWPRPEKWIPPPLKWAVGQFTLESGDFTDRGAQDIVTKRECYFLLGTFTKDLKDQFKLSYPLIYKDQPDKYPNGVEHCFEITVVAEGIDPLRKYVHVFCKGEYAATCFEMKEKVTISIKDNPPWEPPAASP